MSQDWLYDPRLGESRGLLDENPHSAFRGLQSMREDYGWKDPELGALEHEAFMRYWWNQHPLSAGLVGLPAAYGYPLAKATAQHPWTQPLLLGATPGLMAAVRKTGWPEASPATWDQFGAGISGYTGGLLDWLRTAPEDRPDPLDFLKRE